ncbi:bifunctional UDP-sugar hydrolase/5'-nucleotidase [Novosphingobium sp.]|uniref:bifunctional metallophosphatase/5'-nucleotidase n=1 Tax=Novosphingobium sp. TaxID=1874826 RepID=UPI002733C3E8|nr:bifunctional metallophosphatase/5'-nucleotidase [Novosphingobium sp.]MDP3907935.1 bifunctional metallophosphatase/5'-nucleotidase [Novosphingobium sp.]
MIESANRRRRFSALLPVLLLPALAACGAQGRVTSTAPTAPVTIGIIALNDFHGALEPPRTAVLVPDGKDDARPVPAGGAAWLASAVDSLRAQYDHSATVAAGDLIGASQIASSLFLDEPAIGVMNRIGLDFNAVGNHEFDSGTDELLRKQSGGCVQHTARKPCQVERFTGASFRFLAASTYTADGKTLFPASGLRTYGKGKRRVEVGFIGLTLKGTPDLVSPDGIRGLTFGDEADAINGEAARLRRGGADAVVVMIHQGGYTSGRPDPGGCENLTGSIGPILDRLEPGVDVIVSGHTHWAYVCDYSAINPARPVLLTSAGMFGQLVTDITLQIDPAQGRVVSKRARNVVVQSDPYVSPRGPVETAADLPRFTPRADVAAYVGKYVEAARDYAQRPVGRLSGAATRAEVAGIGNQGGPLGNLIADAQLAATAGAGAQIAFMNPFGIRAPLNPAADGGLTFGAIYAAQPFNNTLITQSMTGAELKAVLEQGFDDNGPHQVLAPSAGFAFKLDRTRPVGDRVTAITLHGQPIDPAASYRITTNSFLAGGGDSFSVFARQRDAVTGMSDLDALEAWLKAVPPRAVPMEERVTR